MATLKTTDELYAEIDRQIAAATQREVANRLGVSPPFLNDVHKRRRQISDGLAAKLGYVRVVRWKKNEG